VGCCAERRRRAVLDSQGSREMKFFGMVVPPQPSTESTGFPRSLRLCGMSRRTSKLFMIGYTAKFFMRAIFCVSMPGVALINRIKNGI
jgi:hypothetical protein